MKTAVINIAQLYKVTVVPTLLKFALRRDKFERDGVLLCELGYEIWCGKYIKTVPKLDAEGVPVLKSGKPVMEEVTFDYGTPIFFHADFKEIPFALYVLIENYRLSGDAGLLAQLNTALTQFSFEGSLSEFVLQVTSID